MTWSWPWLRVTADICRILFFSSLDFKTDWSISNSNFDGMAFQHTHVFKFSFIAHLTHSKRPEHMSTHYPKVEFLLWGVHISLNSSGCICCFHQYTRNNTFLAVCMRGANGDTFIFARAAAATQWVCGDGYSAAHSGWALCMHAASQCVSCVYVCDSV